MSEDKSDITCPFCGEKGFDKYGLKYHLERWCKEYSDADKVKSNE